jgi:uncharacterized protein YceK
METISRHRGGGFIAVVAALAVLMVLTGCATVNKDTGEKVKLTFEQNANEVIVGAGNAYLLAGEVAVDLRMAGVITDAQFQEANNLGVKLRAARMLAGNALIAFIEVKKAGGDTGKARDKVITALAVLARDFANVAQNLAVLQGLQK